jgi:hypothetical protein
MAFKITSITTKPNVSVPDFDVWLSTVPESAIAAFPDAAGKTPVQVIEESVAALDDPANGFISQGSIPDDNDLIWTWEAIWTSQADWINASTASIFIISNDPNDPCATPNVQTAGSYLRKLYQTENGITVETFYSNI